jgi:hypothetical protein
MLKYPKIPDPNTGDTNEVLVDRQLAPMSSGFTPDGLRVWSCSGRYVYLVLTPVTAQTGYKVGISAADRSTVLPAVGLGNFTTGLI